MGLLKPVGIRTHQAKERKALEAVGKLMNELNDNATPHGQVGGEGVVGGEGEKGPGE